MKRQDLQLPRSSCVFCCCGGGVRGVCGSLGVSLTPIDHGATAGGGGTFGRFSKGDIFAVKALGYVEVFLMMIALHDI